MARISSARAHSTSGGATPSPRSPSSMRARSQRVAFEQRLAQVEHVVARDVEHRLAHLLEGDPALREEERELLHLLLGGEQIAFDAVGDELQRLRGPLPGPAPSSRPASHSGSALRVTVFASTTTPGALQRLEPGRFLRPPVEAGKLDEGHGVGRRRFALACSARAPSTPGLPPGMRSSRMRRAANSDCELPANASSLHLKPASAVSTSRSV